jgi:hypothetical protein
MISDLQVVPKVWGSEQWIVNGDRYCGKLLLLMRGWQCSLHRHVVKDETFFVLSGRVRMELGVETFRTGAWTKYACASRRVASVCGTDERRNYRDFDASR